MKNLCFIADQTCEAPVQRQTLGSVRLRSVFSRSSDAQLLGQPGQDHFQVVFGESGSHQSKIAFAVCDGVGSSFMGDLGARLLSKALCYALWSILSAPPPTKSAQIVVGLTDFLDKFVPNSTRAVMEFALPDKLPALTRRALDEQRAYGSEAMFVCGMLLNGCWTFAWLGDARLQILDEHLCAVEGVSAIPDTNNRWSSSRGARGVVQAHVFRAKSAQAIKHILAFSDGLASVETQLASMTDEAINAEVARLTLSTTSDDISLLHFML